jgi:hypothetical protein
MRISMMADKVMVLWMMHIMAIMMMMQMRKATNTAYLSVSIFCIIVLQGSC